MLAAVVIGIILTLVTLVFSEIYIVAYGGKLFTVTELFEVLGLIILSTLANTSIMFFFVSLFASPNAFSTGCTIIGTLCGFLTGIYLPVGMLPEAVQYIIKVFPPSHAAVLMRQAIMERPLAEGFAGAPAKGTRGLQIVYGGYFYIRKLYYACMAKHINSRGLGDIVLRTRGNYRLTQAKNKVTRT